MYFSMACGVGDTWSIVTWALLPEPSVYCVLGYTDLIPDDPNVSFILLPRPHWLIDDITTNTNNSIMKQNITKHYNIRRLSATLRCNETEERNGIDKSIWKEGGKKKNLNKSNSHWSLPKWSTEIIGLGLTTIRPLGIWLVDIVRSVEFLALLHIRPSPLGDDDDVEPTLYRFVVRCDVMQVIGYKWKANQIKHINKNVNEHNLSKQNKIWFNLAFS